MATWTAFYVKTDNIDLVIEQLKKLSCINTATNGNFPSDLSKKYLLNENATPNYLAVSMTQPDWVTIVHNSFNRLSEWSKNISAKLDTKVIVTLAQSVSSGYYFSLYDKGQQLREIEVCYSEDFNPINRGQRFDFENEQPGSKVDYDDETEYYFGFEEIENYCKHFGLRIQTDYNGMAWTILKVEEKQEILNNLVKTRKPW